MKPAMGTSIIEGGVNEENVGWDDGNGDRLKEEEDYNVYKKTRDEED